MNYLKLIFGIDTYSIGFERIIYLVLKVIGEKWEDYAFQRDFLEQDLTGAEVEWIRQCAEQAQVLQISNVLLIHIPQVFLHRIGQRRELYDCIMINRLIFENEELFRFALEIAKQNGFDDPAEDRPHYVNKNPHYLLTSEVQECLYQRIVRDIRLIMGGNSTSLTKIVQREKCRSNTQKIISEVLHKKQ